MNFLHLQILSRCPMRFLHLECSDVHLFSIHDSDLSDIPSWFQVLFAIVFHESRNHLLLVTYISCIPLNPHGNEITNQTNTTRNPLLLVS
jgi:hypothetical protein